MGFLAMLAMTHSTLLRAGFGGRGGGGEAAVASFHTMRLHVISTEGRNLPIG